MSTMSASVVTIDAISPHPNADRLCLARIKGWQAVIRKLDDGSPQFAPGERVVFIPPDSTITRDRADALGITGYLADRIDMHGDRRLVVKQVRLRGEPSFGLLLEPEDPAWKVGDDVSSHYGVGKFQPPVKVTAGDATKESPRFHR
jgi:RNA ligase (TIGR02306 family)